MYQRTTTSSGSSRTGIQHVCWVSPTEFWSASLTPPTVTAYKVNSSTSAEETPEDIIMPLEDSQISSPHSLGIVSIEALIANHVVASSSLDGTIALYNSLTAQNYSIIHCGRMKNWTLSLAPIEKAPLFWLATGTSQASVRLAKLSLSEAGM